MWDSMLSGGYERHCAGILYVDPPLKVLGPLVNLTHHRINSYCFCKAPGSWSRSLGYFTKLLIKIATISLEQQQTHKLCSENSLLSSHTNLTNEQHNVFFVYHFISWCGSNLLQHYFSSLFCYPFFLIRLEVDHSTLRKVELRSIL
jgi:hypothetical protein